MIDEIIQVLLIEDNLLDAELIQDMLNSIKRTTFHISKTSMLSEGIEILEKNEFDLVLLDLNLPDQMGLETLHRVIQQNSRVPVVVISALDDEDLALSAVKEGAEDYLFKGHFDRGILASSIRYAIERKRVNVELIKVQERLEQMVEERTAELKKVNEELRMEITYRKRTEETLRESQSRFIKMTEVLPVVFWMYSPEPMKILYVSPAFEKIYGRPLKQYYDNPLLWLEVVHPDDLNRVEHSLKSQFGKERDLEYRIIRPDGSVRWIIDRIHPFKDENDKYTYVFGVIEDISERKKIEEELRILSITDNLTGLFNQRHFFKKIKEEVRRARRLSYPLCLIMFDLDDFKYFNDTFGHLKGDEVLRNVGVLTLNSIRKDVDTAFRYGGDEFVIILPDLQKEDARVVGNRIAENVRNSLEGIRISIGIATLESDLTVEDIIEKADREMYSEKVLGRTSR